MSKIDFLKEQIIEARTFVNRLMSELPEGLWYVIPEGTDSNFIWQVGHLLVSQNFHTLTAVTGVMDRRREDALCVAGRSLIRRKTL